MLDQPSGISSPRAEMERSRGVAFKVMRVLALVIGVMGVAALLTGCGRAGLPVAPDDAIRAASLGLPFNSFSETRWS
jgi:hypothetical protein